MDAQQKECLNVMGEDDIVSNEMTTTSEKIQVTRMKIFS